MDRYVKYFLISLLVVNILAIDIFLYLFWNKENFISMVKNDTCPANCKELINGVIFTEIPRIFKFYFQTIFYRSIKMITI